MDAITRQLDAPEPSQEPGDRRPSITRLAVALGASAWGASAWGIPALGELALGELADGLCLPLCLLFARHLRFDGADPFWADRDRLVFSPALTQLADILAGLVGMPMGGFTAPGQALGTGTGTALAERMLAARFGRSLVDHRTWVVGLGSDLATGAVQEAAWLAGMWRLGRLTAIAAVHSADAPGLAGFAAAGWSVRRVDSSDAGDVAAAMSAALRAQKPTLIACLTADVARRTTLRTVPETAIAETNAASCTEESRLAWKAIGRRNAGIRRTWLKRLTRHASRPDFEAAMAGKLPHGWHAALSEPLTPPGSNQDQPSTASALRGTLPRLAAALPDLAALPGNPAWQIFGLPPEFSGTHASAGRLVQGIGAAMAGVALHGGVLPLCAHGLSEAEDVRPGLRAAANAGLRLIKILVEPATHCPAAGQRSSLRAMRNLHVFRPADATEALECAELALRRVGGPSVLLLCETAVPLLAERPSRTRCARGGYVLVDTAAPRAASLIASGPDLHLALAARSRLAESGVPVAVVSLPCWEFFAQQDAAWQEAVLGHAPRVGLEAGSGFGWERWLGQDGLFIGTDALADGSAPKLTPNRVAELVVRHLGIPLAN